MKILFAKCFGIGNAVMSVPALKMLRFFWPEARIDVLVGTTPDDGGAWDVMRLLLKEPSAPYDKNVPLIDNLYRDSVPLSEVYDTAILSIPFDGRWRNGVHFKATACVDGRTRPDPSTTGLVSWKRHEAEYQLDTVRWMTDHDGDLRKDCRFFSEKLLRGIEDYWKPINKRIYLGVGYKKDVAGFWKVKHWGNENYVNLVKMLLASDPELTVVATGDMADVQQSLAPISRGVGSDPRFRISTAPSLTGCFELVASCGTYVGNDTGMMHVAAACGRKVVAVFNLENSITKSRPLCDHSIVLDGSKSPVTVDQMYEAVRDILQRV